MQRPWVLLATATFCLSIPAYAQQPQTAQLVIAEPPTPTTAIVSPPPKLAFPMPAPPRDRPPARKFVPWASPAPRPWYGYQTLAADGLSLLVALGGLRADTGVVSTIGMGGFALGGPIIHLVHHNYLAAGGSLALRVGAPFLFGFVGSQMENCGPNSGWFCGVAGAVIGGSLGILTASIIDAAVLAHEPEEAYATAPSLLPSVGLSFAHNQPALSLGGHF